MNDKILIIDDNPEICEMYKIVLEIDWYKVKIELDWTNGISSAIEFKPDFIILDIMMPNINWFDILKLINKNQDLNTIVLVNSNLNDIKDEKKALKLWAAKFLRKADYTPTQVVEVIKELSK